ncbi:hypothetical protein GCM10027062_15520 [Nocardioides hungaricus]
MSEPGGWPRQPDSRTCGPSVVVVRAGLPGPWPRFREDVLATHRRLNRLWPRALGTTPWAIARELRMTGRGGRVRRYRRAEVLAALPDPVPVYLGSRWLPRHVVLVLGEHDGEPVVYDPALGAAVPMSAARWRHAWWAILPG